MSLEANSFSINNSRKTRWLSWLALKPKCGAGLMKALVYRLIPGLKAFPRTFRYFSHLYDAQVRGPSWQSSSSQVSILVKVLNRRTRHGILCPTRLMLRRCFSQCHGEIIQDHEHSCLQSHSWVSEFRIMGLRIGTRALECSSYMWLTGSFKESSSENNLEDTSMRG